MAKEILKNSSTLEVIGSPGVRVVSETVDSGEAKERKKFTISGKTKLNKPTIIGTLRLTASENRRFLKAPSINKISNRSIELNSNLRLSLVNIERNTSSNIIEYYYNLIYTARENINKLNRLNYNLENKTVQKVTKVTGIDRVVCGRQTINKKGEKRKMSIFGTPDTAFKVAVVKNQIIRDSIEAGKIRDGYRGRISGVHQTSILSHKNYNASTSDDKFKIIDGKLNQKGEYSFFQDFPKIKISDINMDLELIVFIYYHHL